MTILSIYIPKADAYLDVDTAAIPDWIYKRALAKGFKMELSRGMAKLGPTPIAKADKKKYREQALTIAKRHLESMTA
jgi:hypothetical protein